MSSDTKKPLSYRIATMRSEIRSKIAEDNEILRIMRLINQLELQIFVCSNPNAACRYPEYKQLVKMGKKLLPLIHEFMKDDDTAHWWMFSLLTEITGQDVITPRISGKITSMRRAWLKWFKENNKETLDMLPNAEVLPPKKLSTLFIPQTLIAYTTDATDRIENMFMDLSKQSNDLKIESRFIALTDEHIKSADDFVNLVTALSTTGTPVKFFLFSRFEYILDSFSLKDAMRCIEFIMNGCNCKVIVAGSFKEIHASLFKKLVYLCQTAYSMYSTYQTYAITVDYTLKEYNLCCCIQKMRYTIINHDEKEPIEVVL